MMELLKKFKIQPVNPHLYEIAFIHESYSNERGLNESYERLEFLGDAVLDLVVSEFIYNKHPRLNEGQLTRMRANYVCKKALYTYSTETGMNRCVKLGMGAELTQREVESALSDVFESFIGALYLDLGLGEVKLFLEKTVIPHIEAGDIFFYDYKSELKQFCDKTGTPIVYQLLEEEGPPHKKKFTIAALIKGKICGKGVGGSKKEAEQRAAKIALNSGFKA